MNNPAFHRALLSLSHPVSILGIIIVLLNDHWWRRVAPSWFTGKIGDVAWLIFAPFLLAALLAWLLPKRAALVGQASIILTGLAFALIKSMPAVHAGFVELFKGVTGRAPLTVLDPTDLLTIPALLLAWWIWQSSTAPATLHWRRGWVMLTVGALSTMANVGADYDIGVRCVAVDGAQITAIAWRGLGKHARYISDDGGLSWREGTPGATQCSSQIFVTTAVPLLVSDPDRPAILYRITAGQSIERSEDGGQTWQPDFNLGGEEARIRAWDVLFDLPLGPFDAVVQPATGNVIAAMGREGVLVRTTGGWQWISVGPYAITELNQVDRVTALLSEEMGMSLVFGLLTLATLLLTRQTAGWTRVLLILAWLASVALCFQFKPQPVSLRYLIFNAITPTIYAIIIIALILIVSQLRTAWRAHRRSLGLAIVAAFTATIGFITPFVLWSQGVIPFYGSAQVLAFAILTIIQVAGWLGCRQLNRKAPHYNSSTGGAV